MHIQVGFFAQHPEVEVNLRGMCISEKVKFLDSLLFYFFAGKQKELYHLRLSRYG